MKKFAFTLNSFSRAFLLFFIIFPMNLKLFAEARGGNGGIGDYGGGGVGILKSNLNSDDHNTNTLMTLDLWRYPVKSPIGSELNLNSYDLNTDQEGEVSLILNLIWNKLKVDFPFLSKQLRLNYEKILVFRETEEVLQNSNDHSLTLENPCNINKCFQIARWDFEYVKINKNLYSKLDLINKVALKLHEVIYTHSNQLNAERTQQVVALLLDESFYLKSKSEKEIELLRVFNIAQLYEDISTIKPLQLGIPYENIKIENSKTSNDANQCYLLTDYDDVKFEIKVIKNPTQLDVYSYELSGQLTSNSDEIELNSNDYDRLKNIEESIKKAIESQFPRYLYPSTKWEYPIICFDDDDNLKNVNYRYSTLNETTLKVKEVEKINYEISKIEEKQNEINQYINSLLQQVPFDNNVKRKLDEINYVIEPQLEKKLDILYDTRQVFLPPEAFQKTLLKEISVIFN